LFCNSNRISSYSFSKLINSITTNLSNVLEIGGEILENNANQRQMNFAELMGLVSCAPPELERLKPARHEVNGVSHAQYYIDPG